jgi:hypothetical protein
MIRQIVKKDWQLLWPYVVGLTLLNAVVEWMRYGWFVRGAESGLPALGPPATIGWVILVAVLVHLDVIPGTRQDWLTRPIKRLDLLAAKLSFVVVLLHVPQFVMNVVDVLAAGYSLPEALGTAAARGVSLLVIVTLMTFAFAAITRNITEMVVAGIVVACTSQAAVFVLLAFTDQQCGATCDSSIGWMANGLRVGFIATTAIAAIALQYFRRGATWWARSVVIAGSIAVVAVGHVPWSTAFAIQQAVTGSAPASAAIAIGLDPTPRAAASDLSEAALASIGAARNFLGGRPSDAELRGWASRDDKGTTISLPLRIDGQRAGTVLWADRVELRLLDDAGRVVFQGRGDTLEVRAGVPVTQSVFVPAWILESHAETELRAELDFWLTSLEPGESIALPTSGSAVRVPSGERCSARPQRPGDGVHVHCLTIRRPPACYTVALESSSYTGEELLVCGPNYAPDMLWGNLYERFEIGVPVTRGVNAAELTARFKTYRPREHFTAQLVVPELRLADWANGAAR